jgi:hypothetical protein
MTTIKSAIVGMKFHAGAHDKLLLTLSGSPVTLVRDPENEHDPNAVRVVIDGVMCGYIPRAQAAGLAVDMDAGKAVTATLKDYNKLEIEIQEDEEEHA